MWCGPRRRSWPDPPYWTVPQSTKWHRGREKKLFSSLTYIIYLKRNVFTPAFFFSEEGHLVLIPFIISISLVKHHRIVFVFIMGVSWGFGRPQPCLPSSLSSVLTRFTVFIKHQLTSLLFFPLSLSFLLKFTVLYFFKTWTLPSGRLEGGGIGGRREQLGLLHWRERHCILDQKSVLIACVVTEAWNILGKELCLQDGHAGLIISLMG